MECSKRTRRVHRCRAISRVGRRFFFLLTSLLTTGLTEQGRAGTWKTRFFQQESNKILCFEKDVVKGVIDTTRIVQVVKKEPLLFCIHTNDRQYVLAPVNTDTATVDYWVDGLNKILKNNAARQRDSVKSVVMGARNRDARSASVGVFGDQRPVIAVRNVTPPPASTSPIKVLPNRSSSSGAVPQSSALPPSLSINLKQTDSATNSPKMSKKASLLRIPSRMRGSQESAGRDSDAKVGSAPASGWSSARAETSTLSDQMARKASRAKSMEDVNAVSTDGQVYGALARLPVAQRENVVQLQKAFLDFRRLALKTQLVEVHVRAHDEDALLLPEIQRLDKERQELHANLIRVEELMRNAESEYYKCGAELAAGFLEMLSFIKKLNVPLQDVVRRLQDLYKLHSDPDAAIDQTQAAEVSVLVAKFRSFLPLLEDALVLDKPLAGRKNAMREKLEALTEQNKKMKEQLSEMEDMVAMTTLDCNTIRDFSTRTVGIAETLEEVHAMSSSLLPWMTVPNSQIHSSLSRYSEALREETQPLKVFRDPNFLDVLEELAAQQDDQGPQPDFEVSEDGSLAYVTPDKMVELIVTGRGAAYALDFPRIFVSTFRMFMQPVELLEKLVLIYCTVPSDDSHGDRVTEERKLAPCRLRILNLLKKWITMHKYDFEQPEMMHLVHDFFNSTLKLTGYERVAENMLLLLSESTFPAPIPCPESIVPRKRGVELELGDIDPLELARQMTLDDMLLYSSLEARDFLNCAWSKKDDAKASPTIRAMIAQFNATAEWVAGLVLKAADDNQRVKHLRHFILTAQELLKMNNFNSCVKILGSLSGQAVHRLHSWDRLAREDLKLFHDMKSLIGQHWAGLRESMATCGSPSIPLISPFLGDLTYIDEMKSRSGKNLLNFRKLTLTSQAIEKVLKHVEVRYWFTEVAEIRRWIHTQEKSNRLTADEAHARSLQIQPRTNQ